MTDELTYYYYAGTSIVITLVAFGIIWWRQNKQPSPLGFGKLSFVFLVTFLACFISFVLFMLVAELSGFQSLDSFMQPFGIASGVVAYFVGNKLALRLSTQAAK